MTYKLLIPSWQHITAGTCIHDSAAIMAGLFSNDNTFLRTPKSGDEECPEEQQDSSSKSNEGAVVFWEIFKIGLGLGLAIVLGIVPAIEIFELGWSSKTTCTDLLITGLIWPVIGLVVYNVRAFIELDQSLKQSSRRNKRFPRFIAWGLALLLLCFITFILPTLHISVKDARLYYRAQQAEARIKPNNTFSGQTRNKMSSVLPTRPNNSLPGYCNWYVVI